MKINDAVLIILFILLFVVCSIIYKDYKKMCDAIQTYDEIKEQCVSVFAKSKYKKINWDKLYDINNDIVAWIDIPGTSVDYPVVRTSDYDYYLSHDIHKKYSKYGAIFIDKRIRNSLFESKNLILYGHNMGRYTDIMFSSFMKYKEQTYFKEHKYVYFYTRKKVTRYEIVSVREVSASSNAYKVDFSNKEFKNWLNNTVDKSVTSYNINKVEQVLTLSTCTYGENRLVLHCVPEEK